MPEKRARRLKSVATELVKKAREAMLTSVQVFNNPQIEFKSELFIVTNIIAWTYLLHAHYRKKKIEYRRRKPGSKRFQRTKNGAISRKRRKKYRPKSDREADEGREAGCLVFSCHCECSFNVSTAASSTLGYS